LIKFRYCAEEIIKRSEKGHGTVLYFYLIVPTIHFVDRVRSSKVQS